MGSFLFLVLISPKTSNERRNVNFLTKIMGLPMDLSRESQTVTCVKKKSGRGRGGGGVS